MNTYMTMWDKVVDKYSGEYGPYFKSFKTKTGTREITFLGRAGEGVWLSGELFAAAMIEKGKYSKVNYIMPGDRRNVLARSFVTYANERIPFPVSWIYSADDMLIFEEELLKLDSLIFGIDVSSMTSHMDPDGFCVVNSKKLPNQLVGDIAGRVVTVDATTISVEKLGNPFYMNMAVIGAYVAVSKDIRIEEIEESVRSFINPRGHRIFEGEKGEKNIRALRAGYESAKF